MDHCREPGRGSYLEAGVLSARGARGTDTYVLLGQHVMELHTETEIMNINIAGMELNMIMLGVPEGRKDQRMLIAFQLPPLLNEDFVQTTSHVYIETNLIINLN